jgi:hypothetical protein
MVLQKSPPHLKIIMVDGREFEFSGEQAAVLINRIEGEG